MIASSFLVSYDMMNTYKRFPYVIFLQVDDALFDSGDGKKDQSSAMSDLTKEVKEALAAEEGEEPEQGRYNEYDVVVSHITAVGGDESGRGGGGVLICCLP